MTLECCGHWKRRHGFTTAIASSAQAAAAWLSPYEADLVLVDLAPRGMKGKEPVNRLTDIGSAVPFILIASLNDDDAISKLQK